MEEVPSARPHGHPADPPPPAARPSSRGPQPVLPGSLEELTTPGPLLDRVAQGLIGLVDSAVGTAVILPDGRGHLVYAACAGHLTRHFGTRLDLETSLTGHTFLTGTASRCDDTAADSRVDVDLCRRLGVASMLCVPLRRRDQVVGVLKVASDRPRAFEERHAAAFLAVADTVAVLVAAAADLERTSAALAGLEAGDAAAAAGPTRFVRRLLAPGTVAYDERRARLAHLATEPMLRIVVQPIRSLTANRTVAVEALARFQVVPPEPPDRVFADGWAVGIGEQLEWVAARAALGVFDQLPQDVDLTVNASPDAVGSLRFVDLLLSREPKRTVLELTEHHRVDDYPRLERHLSRLRRGGVRISVDDTGAGYASLSHIVRLAPDAIKLDRALVAGIDRDPVRQALATALVDFAHRTGAIVIAEGVETASELAVVRELGFDQAQGFHLGRPASAEDVFRAASAPARPAADPPRPGQRPASEA